MPMTEKCFVRLKIISKLLTPQEITQILGIPFDTAWKIGDQKPGSSVKTKENTWIVDSGLAEESELESQIEALLERLRPVNSRMKLLPAGTVIDVSCAIYAPSVPALYFDNAVIKRIGDLGANFDIDLYILGNQELSD